MVDKPDIPDIAAATVAHVRDLRDRIAAVIAKHHNYPEDYLEQCLCPEWNWQDGVSYSDHVSDAVIRELGLKADGCPCTQRGPNCAHRYVTEWETDD